MGVPGPVTRVGKLPNEVPPAWSVVPASPGGPASPFSPAAPAGPAGPASPFSPAAPAGPASPFSPGAPAGPMSPFGPAGPAAPVWFQLSGVSSLLPHASPFALSMTRTM